jgi:ligand-binding sensor domain-containing protein/signal transduction histidine kinase
MRKFRISCLVLLLATPALALDADRTLTQALHRIWQVPQGLPQATIYSIKQGQDGYLWLGTQTGLVRFDGVRFTSLAESNLWIRDLAQDDKGALWLATNNMGVVRLQNGNRTIFSTPEGLPADNVHSLFFSESSRTLWACTSGGLGRFDAGRFVSYRTAQGLPTDNVRAVCEAKDGTIWVGGDATQLAFWNGKNFTAYPLQSLPEYSSVRALLYSADGAVWVGTTSGLVRIKNGQEKRFATADGLADDWIYCLIQGKDGTIWIGTKDGYTRFRNGEFESFRAKDGLSQSTVYTLFEDHEGSLWVGTKHGLNQFLDRRTLPFTASEGLASNNTGPVLQDSTGSIWVGTLDAGLSHFDGRRFSSLTSQQGLVSNQINALADGGDGLWVGSDRGLMFLSNGRVETTYTTAQGLPADNIKCLFRDSEANLWIGTSAGPAVFQNGTFSPLQGLEKPFRSPVVAMIRRREGSLVFADDNGGLYRYSAGKLNEIAQEGIPRRNVDAFYEDADGLLWMGTLGGGLRLMEDGKITRYGMRDGLYDDDIFGIVCDDQDRLWMACSKGIFYVSRSDLRKFAAGEIRRFVSTPFSPTDALRTIECKSEVQPAAWRMKDGRLWFSTIRGVIVVDPNRLTRKLPAPPVVIEEVIVNGVRQAAADVARLPPGVNNLEFRYTALSYLVPGRITFKYKLEGFDEHWVEAGGRREAFYTNLPPGKFTFRVAALNVDGTSSEAANGVGFIVMPYVYQRAWFVPACVLLAGALSWIGYRLRVRRIKAGLVAIVAERSRIARELHDTLLQGFSGVTMEMQALSARLPTSAEQNTLHEIIRDAATCMSEARRSVAGLRGASGSESGLAAAIERTARQITETKDVKLRLDLKDGGPGLAADVEYNLLRIAAEAVSNSVRHSGARLIEVTMESTPGVLRLSVSDDGMGFVRGNGNGGARGGGREHYGLVGMEERAKQIGAEFELKSEPARGTVVRIELLREN